MDLMREHAQCRVVIVVAVAVSARIMHIARNCTVNGNERAKNKRKVRLSSLHFCSCLFAIYIKQRLASAGRTSMFTHIDNTLQHVLNTRDGSMMPAPANERSYRCAKNTKHRLEINTKYR